jgi:muramoyltetrapeptide carboxypeptidase
VVTSPRLIKPRAIAPGATLGIAAPGGPVDPALLAGGRAVWEAAGFRVVHRADLLARRAYLAGDDDRRVAELSELIADPAVDAIVCARGGYGLPRILDRLDAAAFRAARKPIVGYSDVTALLLWQRRCAGLVGFHGPMLERGSDVDPAALRALIAALTGTAREADRRWKGTARIAGRRTGRLVGGNLALVAASLGTPWEVDTRGAILLVEDVHEPPYRIDRLFQQLRAAGKLARIAGLGTGAFTGCVDERYPEPSAEDVVEEIARSLRIPLVTGLPFGHTKDNRAWPVGARATLDGGKGTLELLESGVSGVGSR